MSSPWLLRALRRFRSDVRGVAAVEFAVIVPVMLLVLLGSVEVTRAVAIDRRFSLITNMIADLVAREDRLTAGDVEAMYDIAKLVMAPYDTAPMKISIIPVVANRTNASNTVVYSQPRNRPSFNGGALHAKCGSYPMSEGLLDKQESVIVIEASYEYSPLFAGFLMGKMDWTTKSIAKPRKSACVDFDGAGKPCGDCFSS